MSNIIRAQPFVRRVASAAAKHMRVDAPDIIVSTPRLDELSVVEQVDRARPYVAAILVLLAVLFAACLVRRLVARYRTEHVPTITRAAMDRRSLRKAAAAAKVTDDKQ